MPNISDNQHTLGSRVFSSIDDARLYVRKMLEEIPKGELIENSEDIAILTDLVKRYPYYEKEIKPREIIGFTAKDHCGSKILVVLFNCPKPNHKRDVSINRCFKYEWRPSLNRGVYRADSIEF